MATFESPPAEIEIGNYASDAAELEFNYFGSDPSAPTSYGFNSVKDYLVWSVEKDDEYELHAAKYLNGSTFAMYDSEHPVSSLSDTKLQSFPYGKNFTDQSPVHFKSPKIIFHKNGVPTILFKGSGVETLRRKPSLLPHNFADHGHGKALAVTGEIYGDETPFHVVYDEDGNLKFVKHAYLWEDSSSSSMVSTESSSSSSTAGGFSESSESLFDSAFNAIKVQGTIDASYITSVSLFNLSKSNSDDGNLYMLVYSNFTSETPSLHHIIISKTLTVSPQPNVDIVAYGGSFVPDGNPVVANVNPAFFNGVSTGITGTVSFSTSSLPALSVTTLFKISPAIDIFSSTSSVLEISSSSTVAKGADLSTFSSWDSWSSDSTASSESSISESSLSSGSSSSSIITKSSSSSSSSSSSVLQAPVLENSNFSNIFHAGSDFYNQKYPGATCGIKGGVGSTGQNELGYDFFTQPSPEATIYEDTTYAMSYAQAHNDDFTLTLNDYNTLSKFSINGEEVPAYWGISGMVVNFYSGGGIAYTYSNDFDDPEITPEWVGWPKVFGGIRTSPSGTNFLGFLARGALQMRITPPYHDSVEVFFNLHIIGGWGGCAPQTSGQVPKFSVTIS